MFTSNDGVVEVEIRDFQSDHRAARRFAMFGIDEEQHEPGHGVSLYSKAVSTVFGYNWNDLLSFELGRSVTVRS